MTTPAHQRAREIVDTHFPNYARQTVPVSITELENAIAAALDAQVEQDAVIVERRLRVISVKAVDDSRYDMLHNKLIEAIAAAIRQQGAR